MRGPSSSDRTAFSVVSDPLLTLALVLVAGMVFGQLALRIGVPSVTGQILVGVVCGPSVLNLFDAGAIHELTPVTHFALGLIAVTIGSHLHLTRISVAKRRLLWLLLGESVVTPLAVGGAVLMAVPESGWELAALLAALSVSTAPATVVALVRESRAAGVFVRTLLAAVALNNIACLGLFELALSASKASLSGGLAGPWALFEGPVIKLALSAGVGTAVGLGLIAATARVVRSDHLTTASLIAILLTVSLGRQFEASALLSCLFLGLVLANVTPDKEEIGHRVFKNFESAIFAVFFTLAGAELDFDYLVPGGLLAVVVLGARIGGKLASARLAMQLAGAPSPVRKYLGFALIPQAGLAVGLLLLVQEDPVFEPIRALLLAVGLTVVTLNEIIGPILTRWALQRSGDAGKDRARLIDFLQEENITTELRAGSMADALEQLTRLLWATHRLPTKARPDFLKEVLDREAEVSSYLGEGLAIPHAEIAHGSAVVGVMGISREGVPLDDPPGEKVHCIVLLATVSSQRDHHLRVLAAFARAISGDRNIRHQLFDASSPAHAYQLLHAEEAEDFNYFLDEQPDRG